ncbi:MAG TPA: hypothetical protein VG942_12920 [Hyphomonadaceae bacterium]|nr:hypothetical protein [Hyphomonadaceae bacterium]
MTIALLCVSIAMASMLAACDAPKSSEPPGAAVVDQPVQPDPLPPQVAATVRQLHQIARSGGVRDLAKLADATPGFRSNNAGLDHLEYWNLKLRTGDWPMAQVEKLLSYRFTVHDSSQGKVYIWPWMALLKPSEITPAAAREIDKLLGTGAADDLRKGGVWPGYVLGIREDGLWLYFVSGSG